MKFNPGTTIGGRRQRSSQALARRQKGARTWPFTPLKRILVPVDMSECSLPALRLAASLAQPQLAHLIVVHVREYQIIGALALDLAQTIAGRSRRIEKELTALVKGALQSEVKVMTLLLSGGAAAKILETAARRKVDLIIMASHCRTGWEYARLGSVAGQVIRRARCPVLVLPPD